MSEYLTVKSAIQKNNNELIINGIKRNDLVLVSKYGIVHFIQVYLIMMLKIHPILMNWNNLIKDV